VELLFETDKFRDECNSDKALVRRYNVQRAKLIRRRLDDLSAAPTLAVMRMLPGRCHELSGDRAGQLSVDLDGPYRLLFRPIADPIPLKEDGGLDWVQVKQISVIGVVDTHD